MSGAHVPVLRFGERYESLDVRELRDLRTGEVAGTAAVANPGLCRRDARRAEGAAAALRRLPAREIAAFGPEAARVFRGAGFDGHLARVSATTGLPRALAREQTERVLAVLVALPEVLRGLSGGLEPEALDRGGRGGRGGATVAGAALSLVPRAAALSVHLPKNSAGVNQVWLPALAMKTPVALKPGATDPWTPHRLAESLFTAGLPEAAIGLYPTDHAGAEALLEAFPHALVFGDDRTAARHAGDPRVQVHGPGRSKLVLDTPDWRDHLDVAVDSIAGGSGRSCLNASTVVTTRDGAALAEALAERLAEIVPLSLDDPAARLAPYADRDAALAVDRALEDALSRPGARDVTAALRDGPRLVTLEGLSYLLPTLVLCDDPAHPLARTEHLFPFAAVVELPRAEVPRFLGPTLSLTLVTEDDSLARDVLALPDVDRVALGPIPTTRVNPTEPHQGDLFRHLWRRRQVIR